MSFHFSNLPLYSSVCRSQTPPPSSAPTSPPTISLIGSRYYPHRISADDLFCTYTPDLSTDFFAIILTHQNPRSIQQNSPVLTPSPSTDSPDSPLRSQSRDSSSSGSSVSARSTTSFGLDYLHEDPYQDFDVDVESEGILIDDWNDIDVDTLEAGIVDEDGKCGAWVWRCCFCANILCTGYAFRPLMVERHD